MTRSNKTKRQSHDRAAKAENELRRHVAEWVGAIRTLIMQLHYEVSRVHDAAKDGTMLARLIDTTALNNVYIELYDADCASGNLTVEGYEFSVPDLLAARDRICAQLPALAIAGTKGGAL
ncbi:unnamed protein product [Gemmata massiliana]|uniref:Uncharacterized protein n=1 Tax=Gemmata massiliana TaxID=1210884 RepID=A0A6P2D9K5_9BACT|nr:hypothetical protein [Gemmata massiliana]VTR97859.1 unnamed protein product [Gemmata massiliana]